MATRPTMVPRTTTDPADFAPLRAEVRAFLDEQRLTGAFRPRCDNWLAGWDEAFSRALADRGWVGMTIPREYGGQGRGPLERHVVIEELLAAGAPVAAHWFSDRQIAPALLGYGTQSQRDRYLPSIAAGTSYWAIGLSEPDAGSDLAAVRTRAERVRDGWELTGTKVWTSGAHHAHAFFVLARSTPVGDGPKQAGLSQFIVELDQPGVEIRPIRLLTGEHHFNEVVLDGVFVADDQVLGEVGQGWRQATAELSVERAGPERFLSTYPLLRELIAWAQERDQVDSAVAERIGGLLSQLWTLRQLSWAVAGSLADGHTPEVAAALVKDLGTRFEIEVIEVARQVAGAEPDPQGQGLARALADAVLHAPGFMLRGGTNEILRGIVSRALGTA